MTCSSWKTLPALEMRESGRLDLLNLTCSAWAGISSCTENIHTTLAPFLEDIRDISLGINNSIHVDFIDVSSFGVFYNSKFIHLSLLPQSILSHGGFTALQTPPAYSKWDVKLSGCRMVSPPYVCNTSTQSNLLFKLMRIYKRLGSDFYLRLPSPSTDTFCPPFGRTVNCSQTSCDKTMHKDF